MHKVETSTGELGLRTMSDTNDLLQFDQEEFETLVREPWRGEINVLRGLVKSLSEQVALLQKQVLPARTITLSVNRAGFGYEQSLIYNGGGLQGGPWMPDYIALKYCLVDTTSDKLSEPIDIKLSRHDRHLTTVDVPKNHKISVISAIWYDNKDVKMQDATCYLKATGIESW